MVTVQIRRILPVLSFFAFANDLTSAAGPTVSDFDVMAHIAKLSQLLSSGNVTEMFAPGSEFSNLSSAFLNISSSYVKSFQKEGINTELISNQSQPINSTDSSNGTQVSNQSNSSPNSSTEMGLDLGGISEEFSPDIMNLSLNESLIGLNLTELPNMEILALADNIDNLFRLNNTDLQALNESISDFEFNFTNSFDQGRLDGTNISDFEPVINSSITNQGGLSNLTNQGGLSNLTNQGGLSNLTNQEGLSNLTNQGGLSNLTNQEGLSNVTIDDYLLASNGTNFSSQGSPGNETDSLDGSQFNDTSLIDQVGSSGETPESGTDLFSQGSPGNETGSLNGSPFNNVTSADQDDALSGPLGESPAQLNGTGSSDQ